jgi:hypothetical protein
MDELEVLLRQFQPRRPGPLPEVERPRGSRPLVWAALSGVAAAVVIMVGWREQTTVLEGPATRAGAAAVTLGALSAYAAGDAGDLDEILTRTSRAILPDVQRPGGVLHALSKE